MAQDNQLLLAVLLSGELQPDDERHFYAHLADCARCRAVMSDCLLEQPGDEAESESLWQAAAEFAEPAKRTRRSALWGAGALVAIAAAILVYAYTNYSHRADTRLAVPEMREDQVPRPVPDSVVTASDPGDERDLLPEPTIPLTIPSVPASKSKLKRPVGASRLPLLDADETSSEAMSDPPSKPDQGAPTKPCEGQERLTRADISRGISDIRGQVTQCGLRFPDQSGTYKVRMKISDGRVAEANSRPDDALARCMLSAIRQARFARACETMTVTYPFVFR